MRSSRAIAAVTLAVATATAAAACSGGSSSSSSTSTGSTSSASSSAKVTLTWWNNATVGSLVGVWQKVIQTFEAAHPNITIQNVPIQNEQFTTKIPLALQGNSPPDIYQQWGGGQEATQLKSGKLLNLTSAVSGWIGQIGAAATRWQVNGQQYGVPFDQHVVGFWYRKDLFAKAGIKSTPTTIAQLEADDAQLKAHGITPIAIGSKDRWPDAFYWEYFAVRECSTATVKQAMSGVSLSAPCFNKATSDLTAFMNTNPFQSGFLGTPAQQGAGSSAGMVANGKAAMELQGDWEPGVLSGLTSDKNLNSELGWFPFPSVPGGTGDPNTVLGGGDGFSCTTSADTSACAQFLQYLTSPTVQNWVTAAGTGLPANAAAVAALPFPALKNAFQANQGASYVATYFDIALPTQPGQNLDNAVANFFASPSNGGQAIISSVSGPA
jgi:raffinose/stachyose/melibiose transport system substrate-binding protein